MLLFKLVKFVDLFTFSDYKNEKMEYKRIIKMKIGILFLQYIFNWKFEQLRFFF